eukprot:g11060.t1
MDELRLVDEDDDSMDPNNDIQAMETPNGLDGVRGIVDAPLWTMDRRNWGTREYPWTTGADVHGGFEDGPAGND